MAREQGDRFLQTLEKSRWDKTNGRPVCPRCFDGRDAEPDTRRQNSQVPGFYCKVCDYRFNVLTNTVMERTHAPLSLWAGLALLAFKNSVVSALPGYSKLTINNRRQAKAMWEKVQQDRNLFERWGGLLKIAGYCGGRLEQAPKGKQ